MAKTENSKRFVPIRLKLGIAAAVLAVVPLAIAGWLVFLTNARALSRSSLALQLGVAEDVSRTLTDQVEPVADVLQAIAQSLGDDRLDAATKIAVARSLVSGSRALSSVAVLDASGVVVDQILEEKAPGMGDFAGLTKALEDVRKRAERDAFALGVIPGDVAGEVPVRVIALARISRSRMNAGDTNGNTHDADRVRNGAVGFVLGEVPLQGLNQRIERLLDTTFVDEIEEIFVVDVSGPIIAQRSRDGVRQAPVASASDLVFLQGVHDAAKDKDFVHTGVFVDDGVRRFGGLVAQSSTSWAVVVQTSEARALVAVTESRNVVIAVLSIAGLLALLLGVLLSRRLSRPLEALAKMAHALAARDFEARVDIRSHDEVGVLGNTMNATALALKEGEEKLVEETQVRNDIARYLPHELVDAVVRREHNMDLGGDRRRVAVLFADIVAFTPIAEKLAPEQTVALLNELFTYLTEIIFRHHGTVDKFIGDSVMALFGALDDTGANLNDNVAGNVGGVEPFAERAVECAEEMLQWLEVGNATWEKKFGVTIRLAIGINIGEAVVGNIGTERRMEFTAIGQTVNIAARLESVARPQQILVTQCIVDDCEGAFRFRPLGPQELRGAGDAIDVYALES